MDIADQSDDVMRQRRAQKTVEVLRMLRGSGGGKTLFLSSLCVAFKARLTM